MSDRNVYFHRTPQVRVLATCHPDSDKLAGEKSEIILSILFTITSWERQSSVLLCEVTREVLVVVVVSVSAELELELKERDYTYKIQYTNYLKWGITKSVARLSPPYTYTCN